jgi:putative spermidine/putrescine transport system permease protein
MTLTLYGVVARIEPALEQAARTMGAGFFRTLWQVTLPLSLPGIVSGSLLVFALSISSFITPTLVGGVRLPVLAGSIYQQALITIDWPFAAAQAMILLVAVLLIIVPYSLLARTRYG